MTSKDQTEKPMHERAGVSEPCMYRLLAWEQALENAIRCLKISEHHWNNVDDFTSVHYEIYPGRFSGGLVGLYSAVALAENAVMLVRQVFSTGHGGDFIAANDAEEVRKIREEMEDFAKGRLAWTESEYRDFYRFIRDRRNESAAHYDGRAANVQKFEGSSSMRLVGANLNVEQQKRLLALIVPMYEFLFKKLRGIPMNANADGPAPA